MKCSGCGHENRDAAKFCDECAAPLGRKCAVCGAELRPVAKFCDECATLVTGAPPPRTPDPRSYTPKHLAETGRGRESQCRADSSANHLERLLAITAVTEHCEIVVERGHSVNSEPLHHRKARPIHDREVLIAKALTNRPRDLEIRGAHRFDGRDTRLQSLPESLGSPFSETVPEENPGLDEHVVRRDPLLRSTEDLLCP